MYVHLYYSCSSDLVQVEQCGACFLEVAQYQLVSKIPGGKEGEGWGGMPHIPLESLCFALH